MAKPRVFVSSTYYDLKYVRERLERFISAYCFDPVLFESDEVFFNPNTPLDESCYKEVENCHMMILIIGGRYGSLASNQRDTYEEQFISITRKEYETACKRGIPVLIFVEQDVFSEYKTYMANMKTLPVDFKFAFVDDIRIFEFISSLEQRYIKVFSKVDDIESCLAHQIAGMLLSYLQQQQENKTQESVKHAIEQLNIASSSMQKMLNLIGGKVLEDTQKDEYDRLVLQQRKDLINFFFTIFKQCFSIRRNMGSKRPMKNAPNKICNIIFDTIFNVQKIEKINQELNPIAKIQGIRDLEQKCVQDILNAKLGYNFDIEKGDYRKALLQVFEIVKDDSVLYKYFGDKLLQTIDRAIFLEQLHISFHRERVNTDEQSC